MQLTPQHLAEIVDFFMSRENHTEAEVRHASRVELRSKASILPLGGNAPAQQLNVLLQDISHLGVGILQSFPSAMESHFLIRLQRRSHEELVLMCVVRTCRELADGIFSIGAEFECPVANDMVQNVQKSWQEDLARIQASILGDPMPVAPTSA